MCPAQGEASTAIPDNWGEHLSPHWLWDELILSFSTMGNSRGAIGLVENKTNHAQVNFELLASMPFDERVEHADRVLRDAKVRMPAKKAKWIARNVDRVATVHHCLGFFGP